MLKWFLDILSENAKKLAAAAIGAAIFAVAVPIWGYIQGSAKAFIVTTVVEESSKDSGVLPETLRDMVRRVRQSEASAVSAGNFILTPSNRSFTLYIYFPEGYKGKFYYALRGDLVPKRRYVVLAPPTSRPIPLDHEESSIILEKYFQPSTGQAAVIADVFEQNKSSVRLQNSLRSITFQLEGAETDEQAPPTPATSPGLASATPKEGQGNPVAIEVSYAVLVAPATPTDRKK